MPLDGTTAPARVVWAPQPGQQHKLVTCPYMEILFGGARGGGKTDGVLGKWAVKAQRYGVGFNGVFFRHEMPQADDLIERAKEIYIPLGAEWREQPRQFRMPGGGRVRFRPLENVVDASKYQGQNLCVAVGTRIVMADGSRRPIEAIAPGDMVMTLEGPRAVRATTQPYLAPCVSAQVWNSSGELMGEQVHPVWHPVLTTAGISPEGSWRGDRDLPDSASSVEQTSSRRFPKRHTSRPLRIEANARDAACGERPRNEGPAFPAWFAYSEDVRNGHTSSRVNTREHGRPASSCVPVVLHEPTARSAARSRPGAGSILSRIGSECAAMSRGIFQATRMGWSGLQRLGGPLQRWRDRAVSVLDGALRVALASTTQGYPVDCLSGHGSCDGLPRRYSRNAQYDIPSQGDAVGLSRNALAGALGTTQTRNPTLSRSWVHPYTGEARNLVEAVTYGMMECRVIGDAWVTDLCIDQANHYISDTGLVNKNTDCAVEEAGNFADPKPIDMLFGALRSKGGVPVQLILTANPGGVGQQWIKHRYIDPAPRGMTPLVRKLPNGAEHRYIYIPSRIQDNRILLANDPTYINRLHLVGSPELVRAWLEGDWNVIAGAFFPEFSAVRHIMAPRSLPEHWARFRSFDWGSARPFAVHWWAVSDGSIPDIARGCLVCYREWYGMKPNEPNVGLRMTAEQVAEGIRDRERDDPKPAGGMMVGVADPAIFAEDGGPSIAARMTQAARVVFRPADNKRVPQRGAMGGWDQLRSRLVGDADGKPMVVFFSTAIHAIRTLPTQQHDKNRAEDIDTDGEDHAVDSIRYALMSRPYIRDAERQRPRDSWDAAFNRDAEELRDWRVA